MIQSTGTDISERVTDETLSVERPRDQSTDSIYAAMISRIHASTEKPSSESNSGQQGVLVGITSCASGDGVTTVAGNLARFCADVLNLKTLMVDASFGDPHFERMLDLDDCSIGLRQIASSHSFLGSAIQSSSIPGLDYLPHGTNDSDRIETNLTPSVAKELEKLKFELSRRYQIVIVDLPPAGGLGTGTPIARYLDAVVLVVRPGKTQKERATAVSDYLTQLGVNIVGAVANRAENDLPTAKELVVELVQIAREAAAIPSGVFQFAKKQWHRFKHR